MSQTKPTILLVDDDRALTDLLGLTLRKCGFEVTAAHHAVQALTLQHENPRDLLILDINMPGGNGLAVCEMLGGDRRTATMPVIIFTGSSDPSTRLRCQTLGARYIHKGDAAVSRVCELARQLLSPETQIHSQTTRLYFG